MAKITLTTLTILYLSILTSATLVVHQDGCIFNERRGLINCRDEHWHHIPFSYFQDKSFHTLDLGVNNITELPHTAKFFELPSKDRIEVIYLDNNQISQLPQHLFSALRNLRILDLSNNHMKHVPRRFCHMTGLTDLILDANPIQTISKNAFSCLRNLKFLSLANCKIRQLPVDFLKDSTLEELNLSGNNIENIEEVNFPSSIKIFGIPEGLNIKKLLSNNVDEEP